MQRVHVGSVVCSTVRCFSRIRRGGALINRPCGLPCNAHILFTIPSANGFFQATLLFCKQFAVDVRISTIHRSFGCGISRVGGRFRWVWIWSKGRGFFRVCAGAAFNLHPFQACAIGVAVGVKRYGSMQFTPFNAKLNCYADERSVGKACG